MSTLYVDNLQPNLGTGITAPGHVVQTVHYQIPDGTYSFSGSSSNLYSLTITPHLSTSKIYIVGHGGTERITADTNCYYYVNVGRSINGGANTFLSRFANAVGYQAPQYMRQHWSNAIYDTPNTSSPVTYIVSIDFAGTGTFRFKEGAFTLMEIAQ